MPAHGVPASRGQKFSEVVVHPQVLHRELVVEVGGHRALGVPVNLTRPPGAAVIPPGPLGRDAREVLRETVCSDSDIDRPCAASAVRPTKWRN
jgi:crotonobetainyl-CoA:carnitine CoA-transferase CaiB-like acyl-CoA transferase